MNPSLNHNTVPTIDLPQWLAVLARWNPPSHILMVGAGPAEHALALQQTQARVLAVDFSEPPPSHTQQTDKHRITFCHQLLAATDGPQPLHHFNHAQESGLLPLAALSPFWPNLRLVRTEHCPALSVDSLCASQRFQPDWVWIDCHPAAELLQGAAKALAQAQVVLVRVATRSADAALAAAELPPSDLPTVQTALTAHRFQLAGLQAERNPDWATAVFVRNHASEHAYTRATLTAQIEAQARTSTEAAAQAAADLAAERKTHQQAVQSLQAQHQEAQDTRAQEHSQQVEQLQAQLKATAAALSKAKTEAADREKAQQDILLATQNQLKAEQAARANEKAALTHQMGGMAKASEEAAAKASADAAAQNQAHQQALQSAHALHSAALDKLRTELEVRGENSSRAMAALGEKADALLKDATDARAGFQFVQNIETTIQRQINELASQFGRDLQVLVERQKNIAHEIPLNISKGIIAEKIKIESVLVSELAKISKAIKKEIAVEAKNTIKQIEAHTDISAYLSSGVLMPIFHGWPISPDFGMLIIRELECNKYDAVVEFGSGSSTLLVAKALEIISQRHGNQDATPQIAFEHLPQYFEQTSKILNAAGVHKGVELILAPLVEQKILPGETYNYYGIGDRLTKTLEKNKSLDQYKRLFIIVDGPPESTGPLARYPAIYCILDSLPEHEGTLLIDDYQRIGEKDTVARWKEILVAKGYFVVSNEYDVEKKACVLRYSRTNQKDLGPV